MKPKIFSVKRKDKIFAQHGLELVYKINSDKDKVRKNPIKIADTC